MGGEVRSTQRDVTFGTHFCAPDRFRVEVSLDPRPGTSWPVASQPPLRIDLLRTIEGVSTAEVLKNAVAASWKGTPIRVIALDDLIANKRAVGRPQDRADVAKLERVRARRGP
jgi:hypothetical protein